jgi:fermentation-respiration switch protein FrsA (DUF1100 family)
VPTFQTPEVSEAAVIGVPEATIFYNACKARSNTAGVDWPNKMTLQSLWFGARWEPTQNLENIGKRPVLYVVATGDKFIPIDAQKKVFDRLVGPKELFELDCEHLDTYFGPAYDENVKKQVAWLKKNL